MRIGRFLRYNARHTLFFPGDGKLPQWDPTSSYSHTPSGKRTKDWSEPLWLFRLRQLMFCFAGNQRCGRRDENPGWSSRFGGDKELPDTWDRGPDGNRTCSYCGSIHPEDLMEICRKTLIDDRYGVEGTTKSYKVYVRQPGVSNAGDGAIKFYMAHAPAEPSKADQELFSAAIRVTNERFMARWNARASA